MKITFSIFISKVIYAITQIFHLGAGGTWPGEITLRINPNILTNLLESLDKGLIIVAGTNGKTTTSLMVKQILEKNGDKVIHNSSGANLENGIVSAFIQNANWRGKIRADWGVFETDENSLPSIINSLNSYSSNEVRSLRTSSRSLTSNNKKIVIVLLNLFRDQLDRYGEVDVIVEKWGKALRLASFAQGKLTLILNADDPGIAWLGENYSSNPDGYRDEKLTNDSSRSPTSNNNIYYFGLNDPKLFLKIKEHAADSAYCLNCGNRLDYSGIYYSHIGIWHCPKCGNSRPQPDLDSFKQILPGLYNQYNTLAAVSVVKNLDIDKKVIDQALTNFQPAFGRQEEIDVNQKKIKIFLSKNPAGFNASLRTVLELQPKTILLALNDRIPDGRDVSWIWDIDLEMIPQDVKIICSGDRALDLGLRMKYTFQNQKLNIKNKKYISKIKNNLTIEPNLKKSINQGLQIINQTETLYILPTYSAMLEVRKILGGRKIL